MKEWFWYISLGPPGLSLQLHAVFLYVSRWFSPLQIAPSLCSLTPHWGCCFDQIHQSTKSPPALGLGSLCVRLKWFSWAFISTVNNHLCTILLNFSNFIEIEGFMGSIGAQEASCDVDGQLPVKLMTYFYSSGWLSTLRGWSIELRAPAYRRRKRAAIQISLLSFYLISVPLGSNLVNN